MTFDLARTGGIDPEISAALTIFDRLKPLKDALGVGDLTDSELQLYAMVVHHTGLDPFTRQIHAIKRAGKVVHQTGIDGYRSVAERTREYAGSDEPTFEACDCGQDPPDHPKIARVVVHRLLASGHMVDQVGVARWHELYPGNGNDGFMWRKMPHNQLAKCAEANGLRKAFPRVLGGVYIEEEMQQGNTIEGQAAPLPTAAERIAARRAAAETSQEATGMSRDDFLAGLEREQIPQPAAVERAAVLFPDTDPKALTDIQRAELFLDLTDPQEAPTMPLGLEAEAELDAELDAALDAAVS